MLLYLSWVLATMALFLPFVFLSAFARNHGAAEVAAAALVSLIGGTSILGRVVLGPIGDRIGVLWLFKATVLLMAVSYAIWLPSSSYLGLSLFAVIVMLGINYGSRIAVVPAVLIDLFGGDSLGTTLGVFFTATGLAALIGSTLAGHRERRLPGRRRIRAHGGLSRLHRDPPGAVEIVRRAPKRSTLTVCRL